MALGLDGHAVVVAHDGEAAMARCQERAPDLVLLDIALTGGLEARLECPPAVLSMPRPVTATRHAFRTQG